jgi:hypothetical protein
MDFLQLSVFLGYEVSLWNFFQKCFFLLALIGICLALAVQKLKTVSLLLFAAGYIFVFALTDHHGFIWRHMTPLVPIVSLFASITLFKLRLVVCLSKLFFF